jgi:hypothetical protein
MKLQTPANFNQRAQVGLNAMKTNNPSGGFYRIENGNFNVFGKLRMKSTPRPPAWIACESA